TSARSLVRSGGRSPPDPVVVESATDGRTWGTGTSLSGVSGSRWDAPRGRLAHRPAQCRRSPALSILRLPDAGVPHDRVGFPSGPAQVSTRTPIPRARTAGVSGTQEEGHVNAPAPKSDTVGWTDLDVKAVNTIRALAADAVEKTGNGHPGAAISLAPLAYLLYQQTMRLDPADPDWLGRDRFVLSAGHSSLTQYIQLYLSGYGLELSDIEALRTWGSLTPGHPEVGHTTGVETTTGPLGQGLATAVGMAFAQRRVRGLLDP